VFKTTFVSVIACAIAVLMNSITPCYAQTSDSQTKAYGTASGIPFEQWQGKIFYVLPLEAVEKAQGYPFTLANPNPGLLVRQSTNIQASWLEGKKLEVIAIKPLTNIQKGSVIDDSLVVFKEMSSGTLLTAQAHGGQVPGIVLYDDLVNAEKYFTGKTIFSKQTAISPFGKSFGTISVRIDEPLKVISVVPGTLSTQPIWLVVTTPDNRKGYIPIAFSNTNAYRGLWSKGAPWAISLFDKDPRQLYSWDESTWTAINTGVIKLGMLPEQVKLVWGEPHDVQRGDKDAEQIWLYPSKVLKFNAGKLASINNR
jgi:hypothetical protein